MNERVSVVILNWNGKEMLRKFLPSVLRFSEGANIVVADNCSTDGSTDMLKAEFQSVNIIVLDKNYGFAEGYNKALAQICTEYSILLNSDVEVSEGWLGSLVAFMDNNKGVAACQPKIRSYKTPELFEYAGASGGFLDKYGYPFCRGRIMASVERDNGQYDDITDVFWATGAAMFVRTDVYKEVGGLDSSFFAHMEEIDLCWRMRSRGYRLACIPESVVYHVGGATLSKENPRKTFLNFRNNLLMIYKNESEESLATVMFVRSVLDGIAALKFLISGSWDNFLAVYKARREFKKIKSNYNSARRDNLSKTKVSHIDGHTNFSILQEYYFRGKKTFDLLGIVAK